MDERMPLRELAWETYNILAIFQGGCKIRTWGLGQNTKFNLSSKCGHQTAAEMILYARHTQHILVHRYLESRFNVLLLACGTHIYPRCVIHQQKSEWMMQTKQLPLVKYETNSSRFLTHNLYTSLNYIGYKLVYRF